MIKEKSAKISLNEPKLSCDAVVAAADDVDDDDE